MTDRFSVLMKRGPSGTGTDENWAEHDSEIKRMVPKCDSDPFVLPSEAFDAMRSVVNAALCEAFQQAANMTMST